MSALPTGFEALEPFVGQWARATSALRDAARSSSTDAERQAFFAAAFAQLPAALDHLDATPLAEHDERQTRLMQLCLSLAHVALAVESQTDDEPRHARHRAALQITRTPADEAPA